MKMNLLKRLFDDALITVAQSLLYSRLIGPCNISLGYIYARFNFYFCTWHLVIFLHASPHVLLCTQHIINHHHHYDSVHVLVTCPCHAPHRVHAPLNITSREKCSTQF